MNSGRFKPGHVSWNMIRKDLTGKERIYHRMYLDHRDSTKDRSVEFLLTFEQWLKIWTDSGHLSERGTHRGQFCMARNGDVGPYAVDNVRICTVSENHAERKRPRGRKLSDDQKAKMRAASKRRWSKPEERAKIGKANSVHMKRIWEMRRLAKAEVLKCVM